MKTTLYRYFDSKGRLLYVGITKNQFERFSQHSKTALWFDRIAYAKFQHLDSREEAIEAETRAIATELPEFNKAGPKLKDENLNHFIALVTAKLEDEWHRQMQSRIEETMLEINEFSEANEITKLGFCFASSFDWVDDGETRVVPCRDCQKLVNTKWFEFVEYDSQSIIDEYRGN